MFGPCRTGRAARPRHLAAGALLDRDVQELKNRQINAEWLHGLLALNPTRDLLVWMNDAMAAQQQWG